MNKGATILLVDDEADDAFLFQRAVERTGLGYQVQLARDGIEAQAYLLGEGEFGNRIDHPFPRFLVTDTNMPLMTGREFLRWLREQPSFSRIPKIVLGGEINPTEVDSLYELGVNGVFKKPAHLNELEALVKVILNYWRQCQLPK